MHACMYYGTHPECIRPTVDHSCLLRTVIMARNGQGSQNLLQHSVDSTRAARGTCCVEIRTYTVQCMCRFPCHVHTRNR